MMKNRFVRQARLPKGAYRLDLNEVLGIYKRKGVTNMTGLQKFQKVGKNLKEEQAEEKEKESEVKKEINQFLAVRQNEQLAKMYSENSQLGASNLAGSLPLLKVHTLGKSENELADGSAPNDGWIFYKPTGEQYESITCHILTVSRGFKAAGINGGEPKFNQIMGGVIVDGTDYKPFIMYVTGLKLSYLWEFGKQAKKYTHVKPVSIPMFALTVKMTTEKVASSFGKNWIVKFEIVKTQDGVPQLVLDPGEFQFLKDNVGTIEETITSLVEAKAIKEDEEEGND